MGSKHASKTKYIRRRIGKVNTPLNEKLIHVEWGECKLGDLFEIKGNSQLNKDSFVFREKGEYPYFTRTEFNNGILGYVDYLDDEHKMAGGCLAVGMIAMKFFYMQKDFYAGQFTKRAIPKSFSLSQRVASYFISLLNKNQKIFQNVLVGSFESVFNNTKIKLPIKNNEIDFEFLESFVAELETERIKKLDDYLVANGLKDYTLTAEEKQVLKDFESEKIKFRDFEIQTLFEVSPSRAYKMNDKKILTENGKTPYVSNQSQDNGYIGWSNLEPLNPSNVITLSDTWQSERTIFYQNAEFIGKSHLQVMKAYDAKFKKFELFYVISSFRKAILEMKYDYGTKFNRSKIKTTKIQLPEKDNHPNYELMNTLISAIQKLVIKDVVLYVNNKING